uniref:Uncharacterized protein n=1 Tax=Parascaris equorum TaxID=6256 RepID=A0A914S9M1_PAREQ
TVVLVCLLQDDSPEAYQARCSRKPAESTAAGDAQNAESETFVTPEASPVRIEAATVSLCHRFDDSRSRFIVRCLNLSDITRPAAPLFILDLASFQSQKTPLLSVDDRGTSTWHARAAQLTALIP